jgi:transposase
LTSYLITGQGAPPASATGQHLLTARPRRYPSDTTDAVWEVIAPYIPVGGTDPVTGGRPPIYPRRDIVDAILYIGRTSCQWRALPADFPPWRSVYGYFRTWNQDGTLNLLHNSLREQVRAVEGRAPTPTAAAVDSQSVRAAETVGRARRGYDAGKKVAGTKRHIAVDTLGLLLVVMVTAASVQDRDAAYPLLWALRAGFPGLSLVWADGGYGGKLVAWAHRSLGLVVQIVRKLAGQVGFQVLPRRWVAERTFSWINRCRRTVRDYERLTEHHAAWVQWSMVIIMSQRLARHRRSCQRPAPRPGQPSS